MSGRQRAALLVIAAVIAVVAFIALRPEDADEPEPANRETPATQPAPTTAPPEERTPEARPREPEEEIPLVRVRGGRPVGGVQTLEVSEGDTVRFRVQTETPQEVHLHGYDLYENSTAERPAEFRFKADETGVFEIELEGTHTQVAELKVEP